MAAVIGDFVPDLSRFHSILSGGSSSSSSSVPHHHQDETSHAHDASPYRSSSRHQLSSPSSSSAAPRSHNPDDLAATSTTTTQLPSSNSASSRPAFQGQTLVAGSGLHSSFSSGGASRFPSPPPSSSPPAAPGPAVPNDGKSVSMATQIGDRVSSVGLHQQPSSTDPAASRGQQPSPPSDEFQALSKPGPSNDSYLVLTPAGTQPAQQNTIHIRDLAHIEGLAMADLAGETSGGSGILHDPPLHQVKYEISAMPIADVIEMVAALLTKITSTNDLQHDAMQRNVAHQQQANQSADSTGGSSMSPLSHSVLAFHGKNVPAITILSYLSRIHKYCPTTYEVFLSLLVYFDRMTERVNDMVARSEQSRRSSVSRAISSQHDTPMGDASQGAEESDLDLADDDDEDDDEDDEMRDPPPRDGKGGGKAAAGSAADPSATLSAAATYFVVDSFNIHRLIIAGVTCASKFFSDVFYTNSRYAKVGGLPLPELNHLELQFLVLNDFRLAVPVEELEAYATMLVEFYAREVVAPTNRGAAQAAGAKP